MDKKMYPRRTALVILSICLDWERMMAKGPSDAVINLMEKIDEIAHTQKDEMIDCTVDISNFCTM